MIAIVCVNSKNESSEIAEIRLVDMSLEGRVLYRGHVVEVRNLEHL